MEKTFDYCEECSKADFLGLWMSCSYFTLTEWGWSCDNCVERQRREASGNVMEPWEATILEILVRWKMPAATEAVKAARAIMDDPNAPLPARQLASAATAGLGIVALGRRSRRSGSRKIAPNQ